MTATVSPDNYAGNSGCGFCPVFYQVLEPVLDDQGQPRYAEDDPERQLFANNEEASTAELTEHVDTWHPVLVENGEPVTDPATGFVQREHMGQLPEGF